MGRPPDPGHAYGIDGPADAPILLLGSSLGTDARMWAPQVGTFARDFRVVRYEHRGHGRSPVPPGPYELGDLGRDVVELIDHLGAATVHYAGVSLGGMVGLWLAAHAPDRLDRLALVCTSAYLPPAGAWHVRAATVLADGPGAVADAVVGRWFTAGCPPEIVALGRAMLLASPRDGYAACCAAIAGMDQRASLASITTPTLVIAAASDESIPPAHGRAIAGAVPGARFELVAGAHIATMENAAAITPLIAAHLLADH